MRSILALGLFAAAAAAFLISNSFVGGRFVSESVPANRRPIDLLVDTEAVAGVANPLAVVQDLMNQWNLVAEADTVFGAASAGGPYNGETVGDTFGRFTDNQREVAFDDTGDVFAEFGIGGGVLGITLKSVDRGSGQILDVLVVINTGFFAISPPGSTATPEELLRATTLHELGHALGLGHTPVGMVSTSSFGFFPTAPSLIPTMYPFRVPNAPQLGGTLEGDDSIALTEVYPATTGGLGAIAGTVRSAGGAPINQVHVRVVGPDSGPVRHVGALTNADSANQGNFVIPHLPPGAYRVILECINGRNNVNADALAGAGGTGLGNDPFGFAADEFWTPGDTFDPAVDDRSTSTVVFVRPGRTTSVDLVINAAPIFQDDVISASFTTDDAQIGDAGGGFHFVDYYVFSGNGGQQIDLQVATSGVTPQLQLLGPDLQVLAEDLPASGNARVQTTLAATGVHTIAVFARSTTGNPNGRGPYNIRLEGAGGGLPGGPPATPASVRRGANDPGAQDFSSPLCSLPVLQLRANASGGQELMIERVTLRASGSANEVSDITTVKLVDDRNGNGRVDGGEPVLGTATFAADNGTVSFSDLGLRVAPADHADLLVVVDAAVTSVTSAALVSAWGLIGCLALVCLRRRRHLVALAALAVVLPLGCGGGGGAGCNGEFNPDGAIVSFTLTVDAAGIEAFEPTTDPAAPLPVPATAVASGAQRISN